ncbi:MAG: cupin [Actinomycetota bacterium]|nr:cupin [Actinomycetota bacterium]
MGKPLRVITHLSQADVEAWYKAEGREVLLGDVVDSTNGQSMSVGFARYSPGASNDWVVTYDEALIVTKGRFSVTSSAGEKVTAAIGEVIFLRKDAQVTYSAESDGAELVYVTYPHWMRAQEASPHARLLDGFQPADDLRQAQSSG